MDKNRKVVVLAGGTSPERNVAILSGEQVCLALRERGHRAILVDAFFGVPDAAEDIFEALFDVKNAADAMRADTARVAEEVSKRDSFFGPNVLRLCKEADIVFLVLHGANGEDGRVQAAFDLHGIRYTGTDYASSAVAMDKHRTKQIFEFCGVKTPEGFCLRKGEKLPAQIPLPATVKPCCGGSSVGVTIVEKEEELDGALALAFSYEPEVIIEKYVRGREFAVAVVDGEAYPVIEIEPKRGFYDYNNKYSPGATVETCPAKISETERETMQREAVKAAAALGITGYSRMDFIMNENGEAFCLEANTLPGMTPLSLVPQEAAAKGINFGELCEILIDVSLKRYEVTE